MSAKRSIVCALLVLLAVAAFWLLQGFGLGEPAPVPDSTAPTGAPGTGTLIAGSDRPSPEASRIAAPTSPDETKTTAQKATLRVLALWPDSQPAADVGVFLRHRGYAQSFEPFAQGLTDANGVVLFTEVPLGKLQVRADRGDSATVEIAPGDNEYRFQLKAGGNVRGKVVDPTGRAVAGATIWQQTAGQSWWNGRSIATADANGTFELPHAPTSASLGAIAAGFGPSPLIDLGSIDTSKPSTEITLQLTPSGGSLMGRVCDSAGAPIAGAIVVAGVFPKHLEHRGGKLIAQWTGRHARTDADGRFAIDGLETGKQPVSARAAGFGFWRSEVTIAADAPTTIEVALQVAGTIHGRVTDGDGKPSAGATIRAYDRAPETDFLAGGQIDFDVEFGHLGTHSDAEGNYRLEGITPGTAHVFAQEQRDRTSGTAKTLVSAQQVLEIAPGSDTEWNPVLDEGRTISGIVLYRDGFPFPDLFVTLTDERSGASQTFDTNRDAGFRFCCLEASTYSLRVQVWLPTGGAGFISRGGLVPDQGKVEIRADFDKPAKVEPGVVTGRIDDRGGRIRNPRAATVTLHIGNASWREGAEIKDGAFRIKDIEPGRCRVSLVEGTSVLAVSDWFEVVAAATVDAGVLVTEPGGALRITIDRDANAANLEPKIVLRRDGDPGTGSSIITLRNATEYLAENLTPGEYEVSCFGSGLEYRKTKATVQAGVTGTATVEVRRCALARLGVWWPSGHQGSKTWRYRVTGSDGTLLVERNGEYENDIRPYPVVIAAKPGTWRIEYSTDDGLQGAAEFTIGPDYKDVEGRIDLAQR